MSPDDLFRRAREAGITIDALSDETGLNRGTFVRWRGGATPNDDFVAKANHGLDNMLVAKAQLMISLVGERARELLSTSHQKETQNGA